MRCTRIDQLNTCCFVAEVCCLSFCNSACALSSCMPNMISTWQAVSVHTYCLDQWILGLQNLVNLCLASLHAHKVDDSSCSWMHMAAQSTAGILSWCSRFIQPHLVSNSNNSIVLHLLPIAICWLWVACLDLPSTCLIALPSRAPLSYLVWLPRYVLAPF